MRKRSAGLASAAIVFLLVLSFERCFASVEPSLGSARVVFQTNYGDIEFGFFPEIAPKTVEHIFKLVRLGCYNTNHFFRVDKGFVAQVADVVMGRTAPMNEDQRFEAAKTVVGEFSKIKHVKGILSMGRYSDPDSASSSFSILLGDAPHLDGEVRGSSYTSRRDFRDDEEGESCEREKSILKRRLSESAIEVERQRMKCLP
ncbi:hypothetical protein IEQ34_017321 [Dendrobium chrysotoxum]|uniref:PPIase cyclophilin-type domain-containing protein n=1 Tax=Dendrobium chrysotoxum TaxID=161865 RepID=A0AAV7G9P1_DENCH|nr:hypothetical protein IEQ34_017321 [Dendrobium chrysotoxum]